MKQSNEYSDNGLDSLRSEEISYIQDKKKKNRSVSSIKQELIAQLGNDPPGRNPYA